MVLLVPELLTGPIRTRSAPAVSATVASLPDAPAGRKAHAQPPLRTYTLTLGSAPATQEAGAASSAEPQSIETSPASAAQAPAKSSPEEPARASAEGSADDKRPPHRATTGHPANGKAASRASALQAAKPAAHRVVLEASPSASSRGWVVQLGSFADRQNAVRLARSLEARGFHMSVSPGKAGSRVLWRVRAGPAHDRAGAQHLAARLRALGHRGEVLPAR